MTIIPAPILIRKDDEELQVQAKHAVLSPSLVTSTASPEAVEICYLRRFWCWLFHNHKKTSAAILFGLLFFPVRVRAQSTVSTARFMDRAELDAGVGGGLIVQWQNGGTTIGTFPAFLRVNCSTGINCSASGTTVTMTASGGTVTFDQIGAGTNTNALLIGNGGSLGTTGTGTNQATSVSMPGGATLTGSGGNAKLLLPGSGTSYQFMVSQNPIDTSFAPSAFAVVARDAHAFVAQTNNSGDFAFLGENTSTSDQVLFGGGTDLVDFRTSASKVGSGFVILQSNGNACLGGGSACTSPAQTLTVLGTQGLDAAPTDLPGTTSGDAIWVMPQQGSADKIFWLELSAYENTTATAQTINFPTAFTFANGISTTSGSCTGVTISLTAVTLPASMGSAQTGLCKIEGL